MVMPVLIFTAKSKKAKTQMATRSRSGSASSATQLRTCRSMKKRSQRPRLSTLLWKLLPRFRIRLPWATRISRSSFASTRVGQCAAVSRFRANSNLKATKLQK